MFCVVWKYISFTRSPLRVLHTHTHESTACATHTHTRVHCVCYTHPHTHRVHCVCYTHTHTRVHCVCYIHTHTHESTACATHTHTSTACATHTHTHTHTHTTNQRGRDHIQDPRFANWELTTSSSSDRLLPDILNFIFLLYTYVFNWGGEMCSANRRWCFFYTLKHCFNQKVPVKGPKKELKKKKMNKLEPSPHTNGLASLNRNFPPVRFSMCLSAYVSWYWSLNSGMHAC
jgi:hypothetical protein